MTNFLEIRLPEEISLGAIGGPEYSTDIIMASSGYEQRNINWAQARAKYNLAPAINTSEQLQELISFFRICKGKAFGFRFKDYSDYRADSQLIGVGDGITREFQLIKTYYSPAKAERRIISKPVEGSVEISQEYVCDYRTGLVTFKNPPEIGEQVIASFEFDIPVRFDTDQLFASLEVYGSNSWKEIPIIEIRV